jgi:hypothetical protein
VAVEGDGRNEILSKPFHNIPADVHLTYKIRNTNKTLDEVNGNLNRLIRLSFVFELSLCLNREEYYQCLKNESSGLLIREVSS